MWGRLRASAPGESTLPWRIDVVSFFGLLFSIVGAIGAVLFGVAGASLIDAAAAGGGSDVVVRVTFAALSRAVDEGLWGPLEWVAAGIWVGGIGWLVRAEGRPFAYTAMVASIGMFAYAAYTGLTGRNPVEGGGILELVLVAPVALFAILELWLALRFWLGR